MFGKTDDQVLINKKQSSSTITSTTHAASRPSTDSSSHDIKRPSQAPAKRALLCGVTYNSAGENSLKGPVTDVKKIKEMLIKHFGFTEECIRVLTEEDQKGNIEDYSNEDQKGNKSTIPTKENIEDSLKWLVEGAESGDSLVFFFSGHGSLQRQPESNHVCLVDCTGNVIPNYDINSTIVRPLKKGVTLYAIVDACHSGSILDLNYEYNQQSNDKGRWMDLSKAEKGTSGGLAICLSACKDHETALESNANSSGKGTTETMGPMTYHLIQMVSKEEDPAKVTYEDILIKMHDLHDERSKTEVPLGKISTGRGSILSDYQESQKIKEPVLSSSLNFDVSLQKFLL